jgi:hypothetical protein
VEVSLGSNSRLRFRIDRQSFDRFHRSMTRPSFTHDKISHFGIFDCHAEDFIDQIKVRLSVGVAGSGHPGSCRSYGLQYIDFNDPRPRMLLVVSPLFGTNVCSLSAGLPYPPTASSSVQHHNSSTNISFRIRLGCADCYSHPNSLW